MGSTTLQNERLRCIATLRARIEAARSGQPADAIQTRSLLLLERLILSLEGKQDTAPRGWKT